MKFKMFYFYKSMYSWQNNKLSFEVHQFWPQSANLVSILKRNTL